MVKCFESNGYALHQMTSTTITISLNRGRFVSQDYQPHLINKHIEAVEKMDRKELLKETDNTTSKETKTPLVLTYSRSLPDISKVVCLFIHKRSLQRDFSK